MLDASATHRSHNNFEAELRAAESQRVHVPLGLEPEPEVLSHRNKCGAETINYVPLDERIRRKLANLLIEFDHGNSIEFEGAQSLDPAFQWGKRGRRRHSCDDLVRVHGEGHRYHRHIARSFLQTLENSDMTAVNTIEDADGHGRAVVPHIPV
jgi:hypothetical protein